MKISALRGAIIGAGANGIANYITYGSLQPMNIIIGIIVGAFIGIALINVML